MKPTRRSFLRSLVAGSVGMPTMLAYGDDKNNNKLKTLMATRLRLNWRSKPLGIDIAKPFFCWTLTAGAAARNIRQTAYRLLVASSPEAIRQGRADIWDSGKILSAETRLRPDTALPLRSQTRYWWAVKVWDHVGNSGLFCDPEPFVTGLLSASGWSGTWIAADADSALPPLPPTAQGKHPPVMAKPLPIFRKVLTVTEPVRLAVISICGLGHYEFRVNGSAITHGVLNPGWTNYQKTTLYNTYDVTNFINRGDNVLAIMLGNGMYNAENYERRYAKFIGSFGQPKFILQLKLTYASGREDVVTSDTSWQTAPGPIVLSNAYNEDFDARLEHDGWDKPGFNAVGWVPALAVAGPGGRLKAQGIPPVTLDRTYSPVKVSEPKPGVFVYDLGQNIAGWPEIVVRGAAGRTVSLLPSEQLQEDGTVRQFGAIPTSKVATRYQYTLRGKGKESWHPRFSYFGFRYVQVEGAVPVGKADGEPEILSLRGAFLHTALDQVGRFDCSQELFVRTHRLIVAALLSNTYSVLTDCPQREKLGWLEQTYLNADTVFCNLDAITMYEKLQRDIAEAQDAKGMVPGIAPEYVAFIRADGSNEIWRDSPEWGAACVFSLLAAYKYSGETQILSDGYSTMQAYIEYLDKIRAGGLIGYGMGDWYDVGPKSPGPAQLTSLALTCTATFYGLLRGIANVAELIGKSADAAGYTARAAAVKTLFNERLFNPSTNSYDTGSQTANAMPLVLDMVPMEHRTAVLNNLVADIRKHNNHVTAGDVGFHYVVEALMENGRGDVLADMLSRTDKPSYGYQLAQGATTLTEAWDANPMNSQNHFMLGHAETWFYRGLGGINVDMGARERIRIAPQTVKGIDGVSVSYRSVLGDISCIWKRKAGKLHIIADIPAGTEAVIELPVADLETLRESGRTLAQATLSAEVSDGKTMVRLGSGRYRFEMPDL